ncbi:MAG: hypothetical protein AAF412_10385 [Pseudomonadota bacterium]
MLTNVPLLIVPFIVYNIQVFFNGGVQIWDSQVFSIQLIHGDAWNMKMGDLMVMLALVLLFFEILKATRVGASSVIDHLLSTFVFIAYLVEFLVVQHAAHSVFVILMMIALVDVLAGFTVSIRSATRDVNVGHGSHYGEF